MNILDRMFYSQYSNLFNNFAILWTVIYLLRQWVLEFVVPRVSRPFSMFCHPCVVVLASYTLVGPTFLGGLSLHLNHLIASRTANYNWPFGTLPFGLFGSNLDTRDLETYPRTYFGHFWNMSIFDNFRAVWVLFRKWVVSENQSFLDEGAIVTPLSV